MLEKRSKKEKSLEKRQEKRRKFWEKERKRKKHQELGHLGNRIIGIGIIVIVIFFNKWSAKGVTRADMMS